MKKILLSILAMAFGLAYNSVAFAVTTGSLDIKADVTASCTVDSTSAVSFFGYDGSADVTASGSILVTCTNGASVTIGLNAGDGGSYNPGTFMRTLTLNNDNTTDPLPYQIFSPDMVGEWGDSGFSIPGDILAIVGTGLQVSYQVDGTLYGGPNPVVGLHSDIVQVLVTF